MRFIAAKSTGYIRELLTALTGFAGLILIYFSPFISGKQIFTERDLAPFFIPPKILWVSLIKNHIFPFWNPYNYSGIPLLATLQPGIFYPPHILYFVLPFNLAWNWLIILHFMIAGLAMYVLLRYLKTSKLAAFSGGSFFMLSGYLVSVHNLLTHLFAVVWFPLVLLYFMKYVESRRNKYIVLASVFLVFQLLAGAPEIVLLTLIVMVLLPFILKSFGTTYADYVVSFKALGLILSLFFLVAAIQWLPFYELKMHSIRSSGLSYKDTITWSFAWKDFAQFFLPDVFGYAQTTQKYWANQSWLKTIYTGIAPLCFSVLFIVSKDKRRVFVGAIMLLSLILALGGNTPLYKLLYRLPPFNSIRYPVKFLFLFFFAISLSTAFGMDRLRRYSSDSDTSILRVVQVFFYIGFVFSLAWAYCSIFDNSVETFLRNRNLIPPNYNEIWFNLHNVKRFLLFSFLFSAAMFLYLRMKVNKTLKQVLLFSTMAIMICDLFLANYGFFQSASWKWFTARDGLIKALPVPENTERYLMTLKTELEFRSMVMNKSSLGMPYASMFGFYTMGGSEVMRVKAQDDFTNMFRCFEDIVKAERLLDIAGIKYIVISYPIDNPDFNLIERTNLDKKETYLYEYRKYPGRFLLSNAATVVENDEQATSIILKDKNFDFSKQLLITDGNLSYVKHEESVQGSVSVYSYGANKFALDYVADRDAFLYVSDTYYPGWRAYVDGKRTKIYRANLAFRAVQVPKGKHTVVFKYVPMSFYISLLLTCIGIALCIFLWRRNEGDKKPEPWMEDLEVN